MDEIIMQIEEKVTNILEINNKCLAALKNLLEENKELRENLEETTESQTGVEEQLLKLLTNIESAQTSMEEVKESHQELYEIL